MQVHFLHSLIVQIKKICKVFIVPYILLATEI